MIARGARVMNGIDEVGDKASGQAAGARYRICSRVSGRGVGARNRLRGQGSRLILTKS